ncbi:MAG: PEGA domain-containing protein [Sandaracinaceae bacterium]
MDEREDLELRSVGRLATLASEIEDEDETADSAAMEAAARMSQAEEAFAQFDYASATTRYREALALLRPTATRATGRERIAAAHLQLALVLLVHGERDNALEELRTCRHVDPTCQPDPARHPPELVALADELQQEDATATLEVVTDPPGATASLDGGEAFPTPHTWEALGSGRHYLSVRRDGFRPEVHVVATAAGESTARRFALSPGSPAERAGAALRALRDHGPDAEPRWRADAADLSEADVLLVLRRADLLALGAFDGRGAALTESIEVADADADVRAFLDLAIPPQVVPIYGQWWFWTPIAAGISIAAAIVTFLLVNVPSVQIVGGPTESLGGMP